MLVTTSSFVGGRYTHRIGRFSADEGRYRWASEVGSIGPSFSSCFLLGDVGTVFLCAQLKQFDMRSGSVLLDLGCDDTIWGPSIRERETVIFSTGTGSMYSFSLSKGVLRQLGRTLSNFRSATLLGQSLVVLIAGHTKRRYLPFLTKSAARIDALNLRTNELWTVRDLDGEGSFVTVSSNDGILLLAKSNEVSRVTMSGEAIWSTLVGGGPRQYVSVSFHGPWGGGVLVSAGRWLALLDMETGRVLWEYEVDEIADVIPLRNNAILFSTCGGGFLSMGDPENYVALLDPCAGRIKHRVILHDTVRANLRSFDNRIIAYAIRRRVTRGEVRYVTGFQEIRPTT
jgi:outer membrane protein assembly factor BamB